MKTGNRVYFHITILVNRSVQLVARNHECPKGINNVLCVVWSCIKMHATHEIVNYASRFNHSCNKMHATHYEHCPILNNDDQQVKLSRLKLALLTERTLKQGLDLLGIKTVEKM